MDANLSMAKNATPVFSELISKNLTISTVSINTTSIFPNLPKTNHTISTVSADAISKFAYFSLLNILLPSLVRRTVSNYAPQNFSNTLLVTCNKLFYWISIVFNCLTLISCYFYLKRYRRHTMLLFDGYIAIFRTFAEFVSACVCLIYGIVDMEIWYFLGGAFGILFGFVTRILFYFHQAGYSNRVLKAFILMIIGFYVFVVYLCSCAFYHIAMKCGAIPCASRIVTCVLPMLTLSDSIKYRVTDSFFLSTTVDVAAVSVLCFYCAHVSLKYFFILPNLVGLLLVAIENVSEEISKALGDDLASDDATEDGDVTVDYGDNDDEDEGAGILDTLTSLLPFR